ncbi:transcriptional regulator, LysR family [Solidesulfovibrio carbinoliphilus subsp. oakridgensis]|uniref:Transcriptional regulator, LysR family n=1 Tax=Solidesulfovibrio carbinoliphilus subsp. oakridgensis TaxID=694327 RepID=G7QCV8_9BACT|nr:LysR family transcriptional regulator [Solidesulfovibrio carbinoliphilus]EHJ46264.1 transcriptional regulator, LysR family [Solidesulfovibrio carbinoliphilus subsp. oakridgensis]
MELRDCVCFAAVAEELHFGRAAARLHMAQPPLSQRIRALEEELGARLFVRTSRKVALTPAGEAFWREAAALLEQAAKAGETARRVAAGLAGRLTVGFVNPAMDAFLSDALARLRRSAPAVELRLVEMTTRDQEQALAGGRLDVGFVRFAGQDIPGATVAVVSREPYLLALPAGHRLARLKRVPLAALDATPLVMPPRAQLPALRAAMEAALATAGVRLATAQEAASKFTTLSLVAAGLGPAFLPASVRVWKRAGVVYRDIDGDLPLVELAAIRPEGRENAAVDRLLATIPKPA